MKFSELIFANLFARKSADPYDRLVRRGTFLVLLPCRRQGRRLRARRGHCGWMLVIINRISIIQPLPLSYRDKILHHFRRQKPSPQQLVGGVYRDEKNFFPRFAIGVENQRTVLPELKSPDDQWKRCRWIARGPSPAQKLPRALAGKLATASTLKRPPFFGGANAYKFNLGGIYHSTTVGGDEAVLPGFQWDAFEEGVLKPSGQRRTVRGETG